MQIALDETVLARARANGIRSFIDEQRFIARDEIDGTQTARQLRRQVIAGDFHYGSAARSSTT
jgi:hypothetical protein